jgi:hypothetical protein
MVQYTLDGGRSTFAQPAAGCIHGLLRLRLENLKVVQTVYAAGCWLKRVERPPTGDSEHFWVPGL